ncbi:MAG TPA: hypothetical protein VHC47_01340, partial [Mucilaginibacter sp.]|nr:hypothetical protein [Mucilaginibacter sp.]
FIYLLNNTDGSITAPVSFAAGGKSYSVEYFDPNDLSTTSGGMVTAADQKVTLKNISLPGKKERVIIISSR